MTIPTNRCDPFPAAQRSPVSASAGSAWPSPPLRGQPPPRTRRRDMANHPIVGNWMVVDADRPALAVFLADGTNIQGLPATQAGPNGVVFVSTQVGSVGTRQRARRPLHRRPAALGCRRGLRSAPSTIDGLPGGQRGRADAPRRRPAFGAAHPRRGRATSSADLRGTGGPPATGVRMGVGAPGLPAGRPRPAPRPRNGRGGGPGNGPGSVPGLSCGVDTAAAALPRPTARMCQACRDKACL